MSKSIIAGLVLILASPFARADGPLSIDPWLSKESGVSDVSLEGDWAFFYGCAGFVPHANSRFVYDVQVGVCGGAADMLFTVSLHRVDERLLMVVGPQAADRAALMIPVYWLFKVELDDDTMMVFDIEAGTFEWRAAGSNIEHKDGLVLASTEALVSFLGWQVGDFSFFQDEPTYTFKKVENDKD